MFLTEEQESIRQLAAEFVERELAPVVRQLESGEDANYDLLKSVWAKMAETGLTALPFPEKEGGAGVDSLSYYLALEEIAKSSSALATSLSVHVSLGGLLILNNGSRAQIDRYLPPIIAGEKIAAFGLTEPNAGSDAGAGLTRAEKDGDEYVLNGTKIFITNALIGEIFIVTARTNFDEAGYKGLSAFIVEKGTPGFTVVKGDEKMGLTGSDWGELLFDNCRIPAENLLGKEGEGFKVFMRSLNVGRISIASISLGIAEACLEAARQYALERRQFDQPIADFQAIQFKIADMALQIEAARGLVYNAARLRDSGQDYAVEASMAKLYASEMVNRAATEAVQIFGGYGYTKDFPVERYFRDARVMSLFEGTSQIQQTIIARSLLKA